MPVLRDIAGCGDPLLRRDLDVLKAAAHNRILAPADLQNPTTTLSNFGMPAGRHAALVVAPSQVAIVGAGRIYPAAVPGNRDPSFRSEAAAFNAISEKIRANTRAILDRVFSGKVLPRAAAMELARTRIERARLTRRWGH